MPREKDLLETIEAQAKHVITLIEEEMADLRGRLSKLQDQHARWTAVLLGGPHTRDARRVGLRPRSTGEPKASKPRPPKVGRPSPAKIDWDEVLRGLSDRFSMTDVETVTPALAENPRARIIAIARWSRAKKIEKVGAGLYEKVVERPRKQPRNTRLPDTALVSISGEAEASERASTLSAGPATNEENPAA